MIALNRTADREGCGKSSVSVKYAYDKNGNNIKTLLPTGAQILREYDAADRLISERHVDKSGGIDNTTKFTYDKAGNLAAITDNQGRSTQIEYDLMNREIKRTERDGSVTRQFYDPDGQLVKVIRPNEYAGAGEDGKRRKPPATGKMLCRPSRSFSFTAGPPSFGALSLYQYYNG